MSMDKDSPRGGCNTCTTCRSVDISVENMCWLRGLTSNGKLAEYWFVTIFDSQYLCTHIEKERRILFPSPQSKLPHFPALSRRIASEISFWVSGNASRFQMNVSG